MENFASRCCENTAGDSVVNMKGKTKTMKYLTHRPMSRLMFVALAVAGVAQATPVYDTPINISNNNPVFTSKPFVNDSGDVMWAATMLDGSGELMFWKAPSGPAINLIKPPTGSGRPIGINARADLLWQTVSSAQECFFMLRDGATGVIVQLNTISVCSPSAYLNERGDVVWLEPYTTPAGVATENIFYKANGQAAKNISAPKNISSDRPLNDYAPWLYPNGDVTWLRDTSSASSTTGIRTTEFRRYVAAMGSVTIFPATINPNGGPDPASPYPLVPYSANDQGDVVWDERNPANYLAATLYRYDRASNAVSKITLDDDFENFYPSYPTIDSNGDIAWIKSNLSGYQLAYLAKSSTTPIFTDILARSLKHIRLANGDVLYLAREAAESNPQLYLYRYGTQKPINLTNDPFNTADLSSAWVNKNGDVAWHTQKPSPVSGGIDQFDVFVYKSAAGVTDRITTSAEDDGFPVLSNRVVAWFSFPLTGGREVFYAPLATPSPTVTISADSLSVGSGGSSTLTWSSTQTTACMASGANPAGQWADEKLPANTQVLTNLMHTGTYTLTCSGPDGSATQSVNIAVIPRSDLIVSALSLGSSSVRLGGKIMVKSTVKNQGIVKTQTSAAITAAVYIATDSACTTNLQALALPQWTVTRAGSSLGMGASKSNFARYTVPASGYRRGSTAYVCVQADNGSREDESSEINNWRSRAVEIE